MRTSTLSVLLIAGALATACGGGGSGGSDTQQHLPGIYVDAANGNDATGDGTYDRPYKSITSALFEGQAGPGDVVRVMPGTYDAANGESFPMRPGLGVTIVGTETQTALGTRRLTHIVGGEFLSIDPTIHATIIPSRDNHLIGLSVRNPQPYVSGGARPAAVLMAASGVTVESCTLHDSYSGVQFTGDAIGTLVRDCACESNTIGIFVNGGGAGSNNRVEGCLVADNEEGVLCYTVGADFGDGPAMSLGANAFTGNSIHDMVHYTGGSQPVHASACFWDHAPPTVDEADPPPIFDADIWQAGSGIVITTGPRLYEPGISPVPGAGAGP